MRIVIVGFRTNIAKSVFYKSLEVKDLKDEALHQALTTALEKSAFISVRRIIHELQNRE